MNQYFFTLSHSTFGTFQWRPILATASSLASETSTFTNMRIDWRETRDPGGSHFEGAPSGAEEGRCDD